MQVIIIQSTISMHSMLMLGGLGKTISQKNRCSEIEFEGISGS